MLVFSAEISDQRVPVLVNYVIGDGFTQGIKLEFDEELPLEPEGLFTVIPYPRFGVLSSAQSVADAPWSGAEWAGALIHSI